MQTTKSTLKHPKMSRLTTLDITTQKSTLTITNSNFKQLSISLETDLAVPSPVLCTSWTCNTGTYSSAPSLSHNFHPRHTYTPADSAQFAWRSPCNPHRWLCRSGDLSPCPRRSCRSWAVPLLLLPPERKRREPKNKSMMEEIGGFEKSVLQKNSLIDKKIPNLPGWLRWRQPLHLVVLGIERG